MQKLRRNAEISSLIASLVVASSLPPAEKARRLDSILTELIFKIVKEAEKEKSRRGNDGSKSLERIFIHD